MWFEPEFGAPGILTISANMPYLQIWRETSEKTWKPETLGRRWSETGNIVSGTSRRVTWTVTARSSS